MLQRHVNNHFSDDEKDGNGVNGSGKGGKSGGKKRGKEGGKLALGVRKTVEMANKSESQKNLKVFNQTSFPENCLLTGLMVVGLVIIVFINSLHSHVHK